MDFSSAKNKDAYIFIDTSANADCRVESRFIEQLVL